MYKIYINESPLILCHPDQVEMHKSEDRNQLISRYNGRTKFLLNHIDMMENSEDFDDVIIFSEDFKQLKKDLRSLYRIIMAAGGIVINEESEIMFIFRRGHWDLPKGKMEGKEKKKLTAIREVEEETGLRNLHIAGKIGETNHSYRNKAGKRLIKNSHWYLMTTIKQEATPQIEEDIVQAEWMTLQQFYSEERPVFSSILEILDLYQLKLSSSNGISQEE